MSQDDIILNLRTLIGQKEAARRKLVITAGKLARTAQKLAATAREKEIARKKLAVTAAKLAGTAKKMAVTAAKKEGVRRKLAATAARLAVTAENLAITAREKESVRRKLAETAQRLAATADKLAESVRHKLVVTAEKLAVAAAEKESARRRLVITAQKLAATAQEKENVRRKLAVAAEKLKKSYETLEKKVSERTKSLEMSRVKEEAILLSIGDGLIVTDEKEKITVFNKTAEKLFGKRQKEVVGKNISEVIALENENLAITATPVILNGKIIGNIKVLRDVTSERAIDKAKTEFVSLASHQLRTPLSTVNWYAEMLLAGDVGDLNEKQKNYLDEVYRSNQRMVELVNALLDVSSLEMGTFVIEPEPTDICMLARSVIAEQQPEIIARKIVFSLSCGKDIALMQADPKLLRMVMQNILSNAIKYTPEGGVIEMSIFLEHKNNIVLKISDTGYGIPKNQQANIFTKLFRADNVRDKDTDGTGLGLYIVKSIVENSGGTISFRSVENEGTTFTVTLPVKETKI